MRLHFSKKRRWHRHCLRSLPCWQQICLLPNVISAPLFLDRLEVDYLAVSVLAVALVTII
jgi:hypothetical protein